MLPRFYPIEYALSLVEYLGSKLFLFCFWAILSIACLAQSQVTTEKLLQEEATLHAVQFVDTEYGWAVGDRGTLLRTTDGGRRWQKITLPVSCTIYDLSFIDQERGWIAGGEITGYTHRSIGVVLKTEDGGKTWQQANKGELSRLRKIQFFGRKHGYAVGDSTPFNPSGLYETTDGGRGWNPLISSEPISWLAASFSHDGTSGVLASSRGMVRRLSGSEALPTGFQPRLQGIHDIQLVDRSRGWLVGDGALILTTNDQGRHWRLPPNQLNEQFADWFDWHTIETYGNKLWISGSPGSVILHSSDQGVSWQVQSTGISTPLRDIDFIDEQHGWAVGSFGTILTTANGGKTWRAQRGGNRRAGFSLLTSASDQLGAEVVASQAIGHGYRGVVFNTDLPKRTLGFNKQTAQLREAAKDLGCSDCEFDWRNASANSGKLDLTKLSQSIAKHLLTYRPAVLITSDAEDTVSDQLRMAIDDAVKLAGTTLAEELKLTPWQPSYRLHLRDSNQPPNPQLDEPFVGRRKFKSYDYQSELGDSAVNTARSAWSFVSDLHYQPPMEYQCLFTSESAYSSAIAGQSKRNDLFASIGIPQDGIARRGKSLPPTSRLDQMRRLAQKRVEIEQLLSITKKSPNWASQVINLTGGLDTEAGVAVLAQLAEGYWSLGRTDLTSDTYYLLARRYTDQPLAEAALVWLIHYYASAEHANWLITKGDTTSLHEKTLMNFPTLRTNTSKKISNTERDPVTPNEHWDRSIRLIDYLKTALPPLYTQPEIRFAELAILHSTGKHQDADQLAQTLSKLTLEPGWLEATVTETWLAKRKDGKTQKLPPPMALAQSKRTGSRPLLDGKLEDTIWSQVDPIILSDSVNQSGTQIQFRHDDEFLYLAAKVPRLGSHNSTIDRSVARQRDTNLDKYDRIRLIIDVDRDYHSSYELVIDERGWTRDHLSGLRQWQPTWFVATGGEADAWTVEVAIPIEELMPERPSTGTAWGISIARLSPSKNGNNSTTLESWPPIGKEENRPTAYGILLFDSPKD